MRKRAFIVAILLLAAAILLRISSNSTTDRTSTGILEFTPVVIENLPPAKQDAQMLQLHIEAATAMRSLTEKNARGKMPTKEKDQSRMIAETLSRSKPRLAVAHELLK